MPRILIVDDQELILRGVRGLLADTPFRYEFGEATTGSLALAMLGQRHWDLAVLDLSLSEQDPLELLQRMKTAAPAVPVIVLSQNDEIESALLAFRRGASASIPKRHACQQLVPAMNQVMGGRRYIQKELAERLAEEVLTGEGAFHERLTMRELDILRRIACGISNGVIAAKLCISAKTVSTHRRNILHKLRLASTAALILYAVRHGLVDL